ncbi:MAG: histidine phosphatase family protein [Dickeya sp.]|uniref:Phosphoglycerate mutase n=1 Tax=Dickeya zeae (strain Ech586) TaxID=590409 RepID=D2BSD9_DICZ5|nr:histidine phosphatase family protein [Dickeya parazeae]ACZ75558.1 Phosphoglycerate mutase [Dickeya parazeae Ech586]PXW46878.1 putative phosphoglycerate mutase [Erwinia sp. AG740]
MIIYLVRHGLSVANISQLVTGLPDDVLSDKGCIQAMNLRQWLMESEVDPDAFWVSHWGRARQTAELLYPEASWITDERIGETNAGEVANWSTESFITSWPDFYHSPQNRYPGGESHQMLNERVHEFWNEISKSNVKSALVVTHSGPISCILQNILNINMDRFPAFLPANASISVLESDRSPLSDNMNFRLKGFSLGPVSNISEAIIGK